MYLWADRFAALQAAETKIRTTMEPLPATPAALRADLDTMRAATLHSLRKNRSLLPPALRGAFWRDCLAGVYTDYAKPAYRAGRLGLAYADTLRALLLSPFGRGRLCLGLLRDFFLRRPV